MKPTRIDIVIADDHPVVRDGVRRLIETQPGMRVVAEAADGREAIEAVKRVKPDLLLLDLIMPRTDGLRVLHELRSQDSLPPTIILTAMNEPSTLVSALDLGARGIILKDSATELLIKAARCVVAGQLWVERSMLEVWAKNAPNRRVVETLTPRELQVVAEIASGAANKEIAEKLSISEETVKRHLSNIYEKLGLGNRLELALFAINHRIAIQGNCPPYE